VAPRRLRRLAASGQLDDWEFGLTIVPTPNVNESESFIWEELGEGFSVDYRQQIPVLDALQGLAV
jgi:hypothetical protein